MNDFDHKARTWDENPMHMERSMAIASKMEETLSLSTNMSALEYGAGTGILSFLLSGKVGHITMMDNSAEMVKVMEEKVIQRNASNLSPVWFNLENSSFEQKYDLIFNQMVLHHIKDVPHIFEVFYAMLVPGGTLAVADLYTEDGSFHGESDGLHLGFEPEQLKELLLKTGFVTVAFEACYEVKRQIPGEYTRVYPVFLLTASK